MTANESQSKPREPRPDSPKRDRVTVIGVSTLLIGFAILFWWMSQSSTWGQNLNATIRHSVLVVDQPELLAVYTVPELSRLESHATMLLPENVAKLKMSDSVSQSDMSEMIEVTPESSTDLNVTHTKLAFLEKFAANTDPSNPEIVEAKFQREGHITAMLKHGVVHLKVGLSISYSWPKFDEQGRLEKQSTTFLSNKILYEGPYPERNVLTFIHQLDEQHYLLHLIDIIQYTEL